MVLIFLTIALVALTIALILTSRKHTQILERLFRITKVEVGATLYQTNMELPLKWLRKDIKSLFDDLKKLDEVKAEKVDDTIKLSYRLNLEEKVLEVLKKDSKEPEEIERRIRYYTEL